MTNEEKTTSEVMLDIASYHLVRGCDDTCDFFRNGNCDSVPLYCTWMKLHRYFKDVEKEEGEE